MVSTLERFCASGLSAIVGWSAALAVRPAGCMAADALDMSV